MNENSNEKRIIFAALQNCTKSVDYFHRNKADLWFYFAFMLRGRDKIVICHIT